MANLSIKIKIFFPVILFFFFAVFQTQAASIILAGPSVIPANQDFKVDIMINTEGQNLNAFEGSISFPEKILSIKQINDGDSVVNFWIERPKLELSNAGTIVWSGITPEGFQGLLGSSYPGKKAGKLFSIVFSPIGFGKGQIFASRLRVLLNDGLGSSADISAVPFNFSISGTSAERIPTYRDLNPPEYFQPEIGSDPSIWNGRYFLVFAAVDKESGVDHYEVMETKDGSEAEGKWSVAQSPYLLEDQSLASFVFVKAVDKAGNEKSEKLTPLRLRGAWYEREALWIIIIAILAALGAGFLWRRKSAK